MAFCHTLDGRGLGVGGRRLGEDGRGLEVGGRGLEVGGRGLGVALEKWPFVTYFRRWFCNGVLYTVSL